MANAVAILNLLLRKHACLACKSEKLRARRDAFLGRFVDFRLKVYCLRIRIAAQGGL
jgi:hypothetical protein